MCELRPSPCRLPHRTLQALQMSTLINEGEMQVHQLNTMMRGLQMEDEVSGGYCCRRAE